MCRHLSRVHHKSRGNHHHTNLTLNPTCSAYVSISGSTGDRWNAEIRSNWWGAESTDYLQNCRSRETIVNSEEIEISKKLISFSRPKCMRKSCFNRRFLVKGLVRQLQSSPKCLSQSKAALQGGNCENKCLGITLLFSSLQVEPPTVQAQKEATGQDCSFRQSI